MKPVDAPDLTLERTSTADQVAQRLRELIWAGEFAPGSRLREIPLSNAFGVSRPTMREALRLVESEGLVNHEMHHGAVVTSLAPDDLADLYKIRRILELEAVRHAPRTAVALESLRKAVEAMERALEAGDRAGMVEADTRFHAAIVGLLDSPRLDRFFAQISAEVRLAGGILTHEDERDLGSAQEAETEGARPSAGAEQDEEAVAEHRRIYERIAAGQEVQHLVESHLDRAEQRLLGILRAREDRSPRARGTARPASARPPGAEDQPPTNPRVNRTDTARRPNSVGRDE